MIDSQDTAGRRVAHPDRATTARFGQQLPVRRRGPAPLRQQLDQVHTRTGSRSAPRPWVPRTSSCLGHLVRVENPSSPSSYPTRRCAPGSSPSSYRCPGRCSSNGPRTIKCRNRRSAAPVGAHRARPPQGDFQQSGSGQPRRAGCEAAPTTAPPCTLAFNLNVILNFKPARRWAPTRFPVRSQRA
jgi:hypothetical protein